MMRGRKLQSGGWHLQLPLQWFTSVKARSQRASIRFACGDGCYRNTPHFADLRHHDEARAPSRDPRRAISRYQSRARITPKQQPGGISHVELGEAARKRTKTSPALVVIVGDDQTPID